MWAAGSSTRLRQTIAPDLYRRNAFRVAGIGVDATARQIRRRGEHLRAVRRLGGSPPPAGPLPLAPPPDADAVDQALARLRVVESRLVDEFFWFWPESIEGDDDPLAALAGGDVRSARARWAATGDAGAMHNLAVLSHALALDAELADPTAGAGGELWDEAYRWWLATWRSDEFWRLFALRVAALRHPAFGADTVEEFRRDLPLVLAAINAMLGAEAIERGATEAVAARHWALAGHSAIPPAARRAAVRVGTDGLFTRISAECDRTVAVVLATPVAGRGAGVALHERTAPLLRALAVAGSSGAAGAHDSVARRLLECAVLYHNALPPKGKDWPGVGEVVGLAAGLARGSSTVDYVRLNKAIVDDELLELARQEKQRQAVAAFEARKAAAEAAERAAAEARSHGYRAEVSYDRAIREGRARAESEGPARTEAARNEPARSGSARSEAARVDSPPAVEPVEEWAQRPPLDAGELKATLYDVTRLGRICMYCGAAADPKHVATVPVQRQRERTTLAVPRCGACAQGHNKIHWGRKAALARPVQGLLRDGWEAG
jgi:hypothetical protein